MKKLLWCAIAYQLYLVTRATGAGSEAILAARAINQGQVPYRDFMLHIGPVPAYLFVGLFSIKPEVWQSLVFIGFNLLATWGLFLLARRQFGYPLDYAVCALFLFVAPLYGANEMYPEVLVMAFGTWGMYFAMEKNWWAAIPLFLLATGTKQTGIIFPIASLFA